MSAEVKRNSKKQSVYIRDYEPGLVYLFQYPRIKCVPNLSPYCIKLETWLRFTKVNYKVSSGKKAVKFVKNVEDLPMNHRSHEGTLPKIEYNGEEYADSAFIINELPKLLGIQSPDSILSAEQKAVALAFEKMIEDSLTLGSAKFRYEHMDNIMALFPAKFGFAQSLFNVFFKRMLSSKFNERLFAIGLGRHSREEILTIVNQEFDAVSLQLGKKMYLMGDTPTKVDASLFAVLALMLYMPFDMEPKMHILNNCSNLKVYADRIKDQFWPDWDQLTKIMRKLNKLRLAVMQSLFNNKRLYLQFFPIND
ncbi:Failed axon connections-like protein [Aphelenchoides besseyi]|nr:Failed axon connections-like protein [Aphelenchoides besseyi]